MDNRVIVSSHQPHFFPWLGYLDKMAKSDIFVLNDIAQLETKSPMTRNRIIASNGEIRYINIPIKKAGYLEKQNREIEISEWEEAKDRVLNIVRDSYRKAPFFDEVWDRIILVFKQKYSYLWEIDVATIEMFRNLLGIDTTIVKASSLQVNITDSKCENLCKRVLAVGGNTYLSGNGAKKYMDDSIFEKKGVCVVYQYFEQPKYPQFNNETFVTNLSTLDMLFNCGIEKSRELFWNNIKSSQTE